MSSALSQLDKVRKYHGMGCHWPLNPAKRLFAPTILIVARRRGPGMQRLDHQRAARGEQGIHGGEQRNDVLMQQGEVGADQVEVHCQR